MTWYEFWDWLDALHPKIEYGVFFVVGAVFYILLGLLVWKCLRRREK